MALQDQTLANTAAKMSMEAKRRRNADAALLSVQPGMHYLQELPWWAQGSVGPSRVNPHGQGLGLAGLRELLLALERRKLQQLRGVNGWNGGPAGSGLPELGV